MTRPADADAVAALAPHDIAAYLATTGWVLEQQRGAASEIWRLGSATAPDARLLLPRDASYLDYRARLEDALELLQAMHEYTVEQLAVRVVQTRADVLYIRADQATPDGSIPLNEARQLIDGAHQLLLAAACSTIRPRAAFAGRRPEAAKAFVADDLRMGHTQKGSFVITVLARLGQPSKATVPKKLWDDPEAPQEVVIPPFQRRVMTTLATGLVAAASTTSTLSLTGVEQGVERGASADLYDSLSKMTSFVGMRTLDLSFDWAPAEPQDADVASTVVFSREEIPQLAPARDRLKKKPDTVRESLTGQVIRLERGADKDEGVVTITGVVGKGSLRNVRVSLKGEQYAAAIRAHETRTRVTVAGELAKQGNEFWMRDFVFTAPPTPQPLP